MRIKTNNNIYWLRKEPYSGGGVCVRRLTWLYKLGLALFVLTTVALIALSFMVAAEIALTFIIYPMPIMLLVFGLDGDSVWVRKTTFPGYSSSYGGWPQPVNKLYRLCNGPFHGLARKALSECLDEYYLSGQDEDLAKSWANASAKLEKSIDKQKKMLGFEGSTRLITFLESYDELSELMPEKEYV